MQMYEHFPTLDTYVYTSLNIRYICVHISPQQILTYAHLSTLDTYVYTSLHTRYNTHLSTLAMVHISLHQLWYTSLHISFGTHLSTIDIIHICPHQKLMYTHLPTLDTYVYTSLHIKYGTQFPCQIWYTSLHTRNGTHLSTLDMVHISPHQIWYSYLYIRHGTFLFTIDMVHISPHQILMQHWILIRLFTLVPYIFAYLRINQRCMNISPHQTIIITIKCHAE